MPLLCKHLPQKNNKAAIDLLQSNAAIVSIVIVC